MAMPYRTVTPGPNFRTERGTALSQRQTPVCCFYSVHLLALELFIVRQPVALSLQEGAYTVWPHKG